MNKKLMLLIVHSLLIAILFSGLALSAQVPTTAPDADHSIATDEHGCWFNPAENSYGHFNEENGYWIIFERKVI